MKFKEYLNNYINKIGCSAKELSNTSGISSSVISRYRSGERTPTYKSEQLESLIQGLSTLAIKYNIKDLSENVIRDNLEKTLNKNEIDFENFRNNLNILITSLNINAADIARYIGYDSSYLSKIRSGNRKPLNIGDFSNAICKYIKDNYNDNHSKKVLASLIKCDVEKIKNNGEYYKMLNIWMNNNEYKENNIIDNFLIKLDEFDLKDYIKAIKFDQIKVPTVPIQLPKSKTYYGLKGFKDAQLDVIKSIVLSKAKKDVFFYSNMSMIEASKDLEFTKKFMFGLAVLLKKGLKLNVIHNLDRPFKEIMMGLEGWIPLYMTGQITPYYFKNNSNQIFSQIKCVGGTASLSGSCVTNHINKAKLYLTNKKNEVEFYNEEAKLLLKKANSLMDIYTADKLDEFNEFLKDSINSNCNRRNILTHLPNYTLSDELLTKLLNDNNINKEDQLHIINSINEEKERINTILENHTIQDEIYILSKKEFDESDYSLDLSSIFYDKNKVCYTYDDYLKHIDLLKRYQKEKSNYSYTVNDYKAFKNINIHIHDKYVIISKAKGPTVHLVFNHPILVNAIENFKVPIKEN